MAFNGVNLIIGNNIKRSLDIDYFDLVVLYKQYIEKYGSVPIYKYCDSKHNMPQGRIITRILKENNISYGDFLLQFGRTKKVRTEDVNNYDKYKNDFITICKNINRTLLTDELTDYGLPSSQWFVKHCPNESVKTYNNFVSWCGLEDNSLKKSKLEISETLVKLEEKLERPILRSDISLNKTGFSMIVINRIFGGLDNAKKELGLMPTSYKKPLRPFDFYKNHIDNVLSKLLEINDNNYVSWYDIENTEVDGYRASHKTILENFKNNNIDFFKYIKSKGFEIKPDNWSYKYLFEDGEKVVSSYEYKVSKFLKDKGFIYNKTYFRDVLYSTFTNNSGKHNCDYKIILNDSNFYIEVAGVIHYRDGKWREYESSYRLHNDYRNKMILKEKLLINNNCNFLFIFPEDFKNDIYKELISNKIKEAT